MVKDTNLMNTIEVRFEYPWEKYFMLVETSVDGVNWKKIVDHTRDGVTGSPVNITLNGEFKWIRLSFARPPESVKPSIWELYFH